MRALFACLLLTGCLVELEADPVEPIPPRAIDPVERDATIDAEPPVICDPVPSEARSDDVPVDQPVVISIPVGCGEGLDVTRVYLDDVNPPDALLVREPEPSPVRTLEVLYTPRRIGEQVSGVLYIHTPDDAYAVPIGASSRWTDAACRPWRVFGQSATVNDRAFVRLDALPPLGVAETAATILWAVLEQPPGAATDLIESMHFDDPEQDVLDDPNTPGAWYPLLEPGNYLLECTVKPPSGVDCPAQVTRLRVQRCPCPDDLRVRLDWRALDDRNVPADLSLHLLHPRAEAWHQPNLDCHAGDLDPRWTTESSLERPTHSGDDADAPGGEQISLPLAEGYDRIDGPYRVGASIEIDVPVEATARIFLDDRMVWTTTRRIEPTTRFWDIGAIGWHDSHLVALPFDLLSDAGGADPWAELPLGVACLPDWRPDCTQSCQVNEGALWGRCR